LEDEDVMMIIRNAFRKISEANITPSEVEYFDEASANRTPELNLKRKSPNTRRSGQESCLV